MYPSDDSIQRMRESKCDLRATVLQYGLPTTAHSALTVIHSRITEQTHVCECVGGVVELGLTFRGSVLGD